MINYSERLNKSNVKDLANINFVKTEITENEVTIYINAENTIYNDNLYYRVARIKRNVWEDNSISYDAISYINGTEKEYKNIKSMLNAIIKAYGSMDKMEAVLNWSSVKKIEVEKVEEIQTTKEDNNNAPEVAETIENKINEIKVITYVVYNKSFNNKQDAISYCIENDFEPELMIEKYVDGVKTVDTSNDSNVISVDANIPKKVNNTNELKLIEYTGNNEYLKLLSHVINNTIIDYDKRLKSHYDIFNNLETLNKKYTGKLNNFYNDYNISNDKFCELFTCYKNIKMLQRIDINNILIAFDTIITKDKLYNKANYQILNVEELNNIRYYLFNNNYSNEYMCTLEEQNNILKNCIHFDKTC